MKKKNLLRLTALLLAAVLIFSGCVEIAAKFTEYSLEVISEGLMFIFDGINDATLNLAASIKEKNEKTPSVTAAGYDVDFTKSVFPDEIIGKWNGYYTGIDGIIYFSYTFFEEGIFSLTAVNSGERQAESGRYSAENRILTINDKRYNYEITDGRMTIRGLEIAVPSGTMSRDMTFSKWESENELLGKWNGNFAVADINISFSYSFYEDGIFLLTTNVSDQEQSRMGRYSVKDKTLTTRVEQEAFSFDYDFTETGNLVIRNLMTHNDITLTQGEFENEILGKWNGYLRGVNAVTYLSYSFYENGAFMLITVKSGEKKAETGSYTAVNGRLTMKTGEESRSFDYEITESRMIIRGFETKDTVFSRWESESEVLGKWNGSYNIVNNIPINLSYSFYEDNIFIQTASVSGGADKIEAGVYAVEDGVLKTVIGPELRLYSYEISNRRLIVKEIEK